MKKETLKSKVYALMLEGFNKYEIAERLNMPLRKISCSMYLISCNFGKNEIIRMMPARVFLTKHQDQVLKLASKGLNKREIASEMGVGVRGVFYAFDRLRKLAKIKK